MKTKPIEAPEPAPIHAHSTTLEHSIARIIGGKLGPVRREGLTKIESRLKAESISRSYEIPIINCDWTKNPKDISAENAVIIVQQAYVNSGIKPIHSWIYSNRMPPFLTLEAIA